MRAEGLTLYVVHSTRSAATVADTLAAAKWASKYPCKCVVVTTKEKGDEYEKIGADMLVTVAIPESRDLVDFRFNAGIRVALDKGINFDQVICLRDTAICFNQNVDKWFSDYFYNNDADLVGAADRQCYAENFLQITDFLSQWHVPHDSWEYAPSTFNINSAAFAMSGRLAKELMYYNLLIPNQFLEWPLSYSCYMSWVCQLLHFHHVLLGTTDRPEPPLYVADDFYGSINPSPHILADEFLIYYCVRKVRGYNEQIVRKWCRETREASG